MPAEPLPAWVAAVERLRTTVTEGRAATAVRVVTATAGAVLLVVAGWWLLRPPDVPVEAALPRAGTTLGPAASTPSGPPPAAEVVVQAAGAVARPGVYRLPEGARVADLVEQAGPTPDADVHALALAARLVDGQRVWVPRVGEPAPPPVDGPGAGAPAGPVDLNTANPDALDRLPGIGPALAAAIVRHREQHGPFRSVDGLLDVPGIGPSKLDVLRPLVRV